MGIDAKEKTAPSTSVGADERQSVQKDSDNSIPASEAKGNGEIENLEENNEYKKSNFRVNWFSYSSISTYFWKSNSDRYCICNNCSYEFS